MMRYPLPLLVAVFCLGAALHAQQASSAAYQPIPASTISAGGSMGDGALPVPLPANPMTAGGPALPSVDNARPLSANFAQNLTTVIPLTLPGYELRVMDVTKRVTFQVNGQPVAADVPIFVYMPKPGEAPAGDKAASAAQADSAKELRKLYNDLISIYNQENVNKEQVRTMLKRLDAVIDSMERGDLPLKSVSAD